VFAGVFLLRGMTSAMGRVEALSYWVVSDHFEELGRPPALLHGGFGLRTVGELRKPRWWALALLERLGTEQLPVAATGDGGGSLVEALATRSASGGVSTLLWNLTLDQTKAAGCSDLDRRTIVRLSGLDAGRAYTASQVRVDETHNNIAHAWAALREGDQAWPTDEQWTALAEADVLGWEPEESVTAGPDGVVDVVVDLPMPGMVLLEVEPGR
jgi:xylan 1,4-beta-xylosidase